jgi:hypothetical protein
MRIYLESSIGCSREKKERFIRLVDTLNGIYLPLLCSSAWWTPWTGSWPLLCSPAFYTLSTVEPTCLGILTLFKCCHPCWVWITYLQLYKEIIWNLPFYWEREVSARIDLILVIHKYKTWGHFLFTFTSFDWMVWYSEEFFHKNEVQWSETELTDMICPRLKALVDFYRTEISNWYYTLNIHVIWKLCLWISM